MKSSPKHPSRSVHISYEYQENKRLHQAYLRLIQFAENRTVKEKSALRILDIGCGRGELLKLLVNEGYTVDGLDFDSTCIEVSKRLTQGKATLTVGEAEEVHLVYERSKFDLVILSHVMEHMKNPAKLIEYIKIIGPKWLLISVPNPVRPKILLKYAFFSKDYSNKGHYFSWDRSHFSNFLTRQCKLEILRWEIDEVYCLPFRGLRNVFRKVKLLDLIELSILPRIIPYFSSSLIVLCRIQ